MSAKIEATGVVLTGGKSSRMGTDKALLKLGERTLLERCLAKLTESFSEVLISGNQTTVHQSSGIRNIRDIYAECGPLGGIHSAIWNARHQLVFVVACDMPFWEKELALFLIGQSEGFDAVVPMPNGKAEPLLAVYTKNCLSSIETNLINGRFRVSDSLSQLKVNYIEENTLNSVCDLESAFLNINFKTDYDTIIREKID